MVLECYELATLMQKTSKEKYDVTLEEIFEFLNKIISKEELNKVAHYYYISYIARNGDAHIKNLTFIKKDNSFILAPVYDVVNTAIYGIKSPLGIGITRTAYNLKTEFTEEELIDLFNKYKINLDYKIIKQTFLENVSKEVELLVKQDFIDNGGLSIIGKLSESLNLNEIEKQVGDEDDSGEKFDIGGIGEEIENQK